MDKKEETFIWDVTQVGAIIRFLNNACRDAAINNDIPLAQEFALKATVVEDAIKLYRKENDKVILTLS